MNPSLRFLRSHLPDLPAEPEAVASLLRERGLEVVRVAPLAELLRPVVVARVESVAPHPNADRLKICSVRSGDEDPVQIVTGADNVEPGALYPLIRSGTTLPNGTKIKRGKLRGELSEGMLGSPDELELGSDHDGLLTLPGDRVPGTPLPEAITVDGVVFVLAGNPSAEEILAALRGEAAGDEPA